jgi:hypothetical protein
MKANDRIMVFIDGTNLFNRLREAQLIVPKLRRGQSPRLVCPITISCGLTSPRKFATVQK